MEKIGAWVDVRLKAKTIFRNGGVHNQQTIPRRRKDLSKVRGIEADIRSITGNIYHSVIAFRQGSRGIMSWRCNCEWSKYVWDRSPGYKHLEGRPCSHVLALYYWYQSEMLKGEWRKWRE